MSARAEKFSRTTSSTITPKVSMSLRRISGTKSWESIVAGSGISRDLIRQAAKIAMDSERMICSWAMGITQHRNGVANVQSIVNFALLRGQIGRQGAGVCPMRGHSNVQGDRTVGIWEKMSPEFLNALGKEFHFLTAAEAWVRHCRTIEAMHKGRVKVFVGLGGNFLAATPDTRYMSEAIERCRLTVQISTKLNRAHLITGEQALILPCLGRTERDLQKSGAQFVSVEDTTGVVHSLTACCRRHRSTFAASRPSLPASRWRRWEDRRRWTGRA